MLITVSGHNSLYSSLMGHWENHLSCQYFESRVVQSAVWKITLNPQLMESLSPSVWGSITGQV